MRSGVPRGSKAERPKPTVPNTLPARRPRWTPTSTPSLRRGLLHSRRSSARGKKQRPHYGHRQRPQVPHDRTQAPRPPVPRSAATGRLLQASPLPGRRDRAAAGPLRRAEPRLPRRVTAHRLDPGRVREKPRDGQALGILGGRRLRLLPLSHPRFFWGMRLHALCAPDGTPRTLALASPKRDDCEVGLNLLARCHRRGSGVLVGHKGDAGTAFAAVAAELDVITARPTRADEPGRSLHLASIPQRIEPISWTWKDVLTLKRHGARSMACRRERVLQRFLCLAACISLKHRLGRPSRTLVDYCV